MISTLKFPLEFDKNLLKEDLQCFASDEWTPHFNTSYYEGEWSGIALRAAKNSLIQLYPDPTAEGYVDTEMLARCNYVPKVLSAFNCELESARFLKLAAGSSIREHRDYKLGYENGIVRIHIPIQTNSEVEFFLDKQLVPMNEGEVWYLNFNLPHSVLNKSKTDRVHLVLDCVLNDWMRSFFLSYQEKD